MSKGRRRFCLADLDTIRRSTSTSVDLYIGSLYVFQ